MFNFREKLVGLFNSIFGSKIENSESKDDPTVYEELKDVAESFVSTTKEQMDALTAKVENAEKIQNEFAQIQDQVKNQETKISGYEAQIEQMKKDFGKQLVDLKSEVRKELAVEKKTKNQNGAGATSLDEAAEEGNKELVFNLWGANKQSN